MNILTYAIPEPFKYFTHMTTPGVLQTPAVIGQDMSLHFHFSTSEQNNTFRENQSCLKNAAQKALI